MQEIHLEPWEKISDELKKWLPLIENIKFPKITEKPQVGKFYRIYPEGCLEGRGGRFHGSLRLGKDPEKLIVFFNGGGVSWNEHTAARPDNLFTIHQPEKYYFNDTEWMGDHDLKSGIWSNSEDNPFRDWTFIDIPYSTGDFHCGAGDFPYTALDGTKRVLPHHGYMNTMALIRKAKQWIKSPETLLIAGVSAGGFGVALMAEDVIREFSGCENITCVVDGSLLINDDWSHIAGDVWRSPKHIRKRLKGNNLTLDSYTALYKTFGKKINYLFTSSTRDALLVSAQNAMDGKGLTYDRESGQIFQSSLKDMCREMTENIPLTGLYVFEKLTGESKYREEGLTEHCVLNNNLMFESLEGEITPSEWILKAISGQVEKVGLVNL